MGALLAIDRYRDCSFFAIEPFGTAVDKPAAVLEDDVILSHQLGQSLEMLEGLVILNLSNSMQPQTGSAGFSPTF